MFKEKYYNQATNERELLESIKIRAITLVTGPRQVGKTTICVEVFEKIAYAYYTLDDIRVCDEAPRDPIGF